MKSRIHPKHKTMYRVGNWAVYDRAVVQRGGQRKFSDVAIETAVTLRLVFRLPPRL